MGGGLFVPERPEVVIILQRFLEPDKLVVRKHDELLLPVLFNDLRVYAHAAISGKCLFDSGYGTRSHGLVRLRKAPSNRPLAFDTPECGCSAVSHRRAGHLRATGGVPPLDSDLEATSPSDPFPPSVSTRHGISRQLAFQRIRTLKTEGLPPTGTVGRKPRSRTAAELGAENRGGCSLQWPGLLGSLEVTAPVISAHDLGVSDGSLEVFSMFSRRRDIPQRAPPTAISPPAVPID